MDTESIGQNDEPIWQIFKILDHSFNGAINLRESLYGKLGYAAKIGRRKDPDAGDRIAAREQPEVSEVGKIRYTSSPLSPVQRPRFIASVSFAVCLARLKVAASTLLRLNFQISISNLHHLDSTVSISIWSLLWNCIFHISVSAPITEVTRYTVR